MSGHLVYFIWPGEEPTNLTENICKGWIVSAGLLKQDSPIPSTAIKQIMPLRSKVAFCKHTMSAQEGFSQETIQFITPHKVSCAFSAVTIISVMEIQALAVPCISPSFTPCSSQLLS